MKKGIFITFEGIDGCGKSTQLEKAYNRLVSEGFPVVKTREPGGTSIAEKIREILISPLNSEMVNECELLLYLAARAQHVKETILPSLEKGNIVLCDRFQEATFAYQGYGRNISMELLRNLNAFATGGLIPDCTFIFEISPELSCSRLESMNKNKDRLELSGRDFYEHIAQGYHALASAEPERIVLLDGQGSIGDIAERVYIKIRNLLNLTNC
jgi:dTMP kinase